jgi:hypothetical protein
VIEARCNIDLPVSGRTPLYVAAKKGLASVTKQLMVAGCDIDLQTIHWSMLIYVAAGRGIEIEHIEIEHVFR